MINSFFVFGVAGLQLIPIFTLTYLQNEILILAKIFEKIQLNLLSIIAMLVSFCLMFINTLSIGQTMRVISSIVLIITLSMSINSTYKDYTIDEGYYITIPYFCIYSCVVFLIGINEYPLYKIESYRLSTMLLGSLVCYILFSLSVYLEIGFQTSYLNYIAFLGVFISTMNMIFLINQNQEMKFLIHHFIFQSIHLYLYLAHLLSVKFELNPSIEPKFFNIFNKK